MTASSTKRKVGWLNGRFGKLKRARLSWPNISCLRLTWRQDQHPNENENMNEIHLEQKYCTLCSRYWAILFKCQQADIIIGCWLMMMQLAYSGYVTRISQKHLNRSRSNFVGLNRQQNSQSIKRHVQLDY